MKTSMERTAEFHETFGRPIHNAPFLQSEKLCRLRVRLIQEELNELEEALNEGNPVKVLDALGDLDVVLDGAWLSLGFHRMREQASHEIHRSNMSKLDESGNPIVREDGKILKGPNYTPPNLAPFVEGFGSSGR